MHKSKTETETMAAAPPPDMVQYARELHKPFRRQKAARKVVVAGLDDVWAIDLVDMTKDWVNQNDGFCYILVVIDVFSRYAWAVPLKNKTASDTWIAFEEIILYSGRAPTHLWADQGSEFYNAQWRKSLDTLGIELYTTHASEHKASVVERLNRTLKRWTWMKFTERGDRRWVDDLPLHIKQYNGKKHSSLGITPTKASDPSREQALWMQQYGDQVLQKPLGKPKFKIGDWVRIFRRRSSTGTHCSRRPSHGTVHCC
jgi:transposase InsO family protein